MKLHLPVRLFRAIIALMVYTPIVSFSSPATVIPDTYDRIVEVDESSDYTIPYGATNVAYVLLDDISITINASSRKLFFTSDDNGEYGSLTLTGTSATQSLKLSSSTVEFHFLENITLKNFTSLTGERYSPIYTSDSNSRIIMANIENISLAGNSCADSDTSTYKDIHNNSYATYGYYGGVIQNKGTYSVTGAGQINIDNNNAGMLTERSFYVKVFGGAIYNENKMSFVSNGQISISGNTASLKSSYINSVYGGAVYNTGTGLLTFTDNGSITISGNAALNTSVARDPHSGRDLGSYATAGGIYSTGVISIRNNDSVIMRKNYSYSIDEGLYYMNSIEASGTVELSAPHGKSIIIEDNINIESGTFKLNEAYVNEKGYHAQTGDIIIDATNVESYLKDIKDAANAGDVLNSEIVYSKTSNVTTKTHLYDGRLIIRNGAIYNSADILLYNSAYSSATLYLDNGCVNSTGVVTMYTGASLALSGVNTMNAQSLEMSADCIWSFDLSSTHLTSAALTYTGSLTLGGKLTINLASEESLEAGRYTLLTLASATAPTSSWTADNIIINAEEGMSASWDNLYWDDNTLYYLSSAYPVGALVWTGSGDMNWNTTTQNWKINEVAALYSNSKDVIFSDQGAGEVTITANYAPKSVLVENAAGKDYSFIGTGYMSGAMTLTKRGEGSLMLATANTYTGGTVIEAGKVVLGHFMGLGTGPVSLTGGTLDFATYAATNIVNASAGMVCGSAFNGTLNVAGDLTLGDNFKANTIVLNTGSLSGGNIIGTKIDAYGGEIRTSISADSHLAAKGKVSVLSVPNFSGIVAAKDGAELSFENTGLSYSGNDLSGLLLYSLDSTISIKECTVNFLNNKGETTNGIILANLSDGKGGNIVFEDNDAILFLNNESRSNANYGIAGSGVAYCGEKSSLLFKDNTNVTLQGNRAIQASTNGSAVAGAVNVSQTSKFEMIENTLVEFAGNYASAGSNGNTKGGAIFCQGEMYVVGNESVIFKGNYAAAGSGAPAEGGAICAQLYSSLGCQLSFAENNSILFENNYVKGGYDSGPTSGGALMIVGDEPVRFYDNGSITFRGNYVESSGTAYGGAIYTNYDGTVAFTNNGNVLFEKNYEKVNGGLRLRSLYLTGDASFSTAKEYSVTFNDGIHIGGDLFLNKQYISERGEPISQTGDVVLSGEFAKAHLEEIKNTSATAAEISNSRSSDVVGNIEIYDGRFIIKEGVSLKSRSITVHSSTSGESMPSLVMQNAHIKGESAWASGMNQVLVESHACLAAQGVNTLTYCKIEFEDDVTLSLQVTPDNVRTPILTFSTSSLNLADDASFTLVLSHNGLLADGYSYMLIEGISQPSAWSSENVAIVSGTSSWSVDYDDLRWEGNTLWLDFSDTSGSTTPPTLLIATWTNEAGDGLWNGTSLNWEQEEVDYAYKDGVQVVFGIMWFRSGHLTQEKAGSLISEKYRETGCGGCRH